MCELKYKLTAFERRSIKWCNVQFEIFPYYDHIKVSLTFTHINLIIDKYARECCAYLAEKGRLQFIYYAGTQTHVA